MRFAIPLLLATFIGLAADPGKAAAHEFWIAPEDYTLDDGAAIVANLRVGQMFSGSSFAYLPRNFRRFEMMAGDAAAPVEGRLGDLPALNAAPPGAGLVVIVHESAENLLRWNDWEIFTAFVAHKDFPWAIKDHHDRGLPETGFRESYTRYAKSLVAVGDGAGSDRAVGMETEIVALANPYTDDLAAGMPVKVLYQGKPRMNAQVEVFARAPDGSVADLFYRTDMEGRALIPVMPGTEYLFDAVVMRPLAGSIKDDTPVWESLWASLTFRTPD